MGNKGGRRHKKKIAVSKSTKIMKKDTTWTIKSKPGGHKAEEAVPLLIIIRDYLKCTKNARETKKILKEKSVLIDGKAETKPNRPVGFMDVITIKPSKEHYRIILDKKRRIIPQKIKEEEAKYKLCRIEKITKIKNNQTQLNLHDGRNKIVKEQNYKTGDVIKISLPKQEIEEHFALKKGNTAYIIGGKHSGETAKISEIQEGTIKKTKLIELEDKNEKFTAPAEYVFIIGKEKPVITLKQSE